MILFASAGTKVIPRPLELESEGTLLTLYPRMVDRDQAPARILLPSSLSKTAPALEIMGAGYGRYITMKRAWPQILALSRRSSSGAIIAIQSPITNPLPVCSKRLQKAGEEESGTWLNFQFISSMQPEWIMVQRPVEFGQPSPHVKTKTILNGGISWQKLTNNEFYWLPTYPIRIKKWFEVKASKEESVYPQSSRKKGEAVEALMQ